MFRNDEPLDACVCFFFFFFFFFFFLFFVSAYKESFRFFDRSGKGYITPDDFRRALTQIQEGIPPREDEVADLMREYDINGN